MTGKTSDAMPTGTTSGTPQVLLAHHLKQLKLPTVLREYDKVAREYACDGAESAELLIGSARICYTNGMSGALLKEILQSLARLETQNADIMSRLDDIETVQDQITDDMDIKRILKAAESEEIAMPADAIDLLRNFLAKKDG